MTSPFTQGQKQFYAQRPHQHLRYAPNSVYAAHIVERLFAVAQLPSGSRVLEIGCGAGRFTLDVLQRFDGALVASDLSETLLDRLRADVTTLPHALQQRIKLVAADVGALESVFQEAAFDAVVGFFFLHHLEQLSKALRHLRRVLRPEGQMLFVEPNRRNPFFLLQVFCCPDMNWRHEKGMFTLGQARIRNAFQSADMSVPTINTFGCFPPQILDRWSWALPLEKRVERLPICRPLLPFRLIGSRRLR